MRVPHDFGNRCGQRTSLARLVGCVIYVLLVAYVLGFTASSPLVCPTRRIYGLNFPGCGLTRAVACLAHLDPLEVIRFHPVALAAAPFACGLLVDALLRVRGSCGIVGVVPRTVIRCGWLCCLFGFGGTFVVRIATWLMLACNPDCWLIPPATFPS